jgi:hypothetical protein
MYCGGGRPAVAALDVAPQVRDPDVSPGMRPVRRHRDDVVNGWRQSAGRTGRGVDQARPVLADAADPTIAAADFFGGEGLDRACLSHQVPASLVLSPPRGSAGPGSTGDVTHAASPKCQGSAQGSVSTVPRPAAWGPCPFKAGASDQISSLDQRQGGARHRNEHGERKCERTAVMYWNSTFSPARSRRADRYFLFVWPPDRLLIQPGVGRSVKDHYLCV